MSDQRVYLGNVPRGVLEQIQSILQENVDSAVTMSPHIKIDARRLEAASWFNGFIQSALEREQRVQ